MKGEAAIPATASRRAEHSFASLVEVLAGRDGITVGSGHGFGSGTLKVDGRIFAMVSHGRLVLKLPRGRVSELIATKRGTAFDAGKGRPLREWVALLDHAHRPCLVLAEEALRFVRDSAKRRR